MALITFSTKVRKRLKAKNVNDMGKNLIIDEIKKMSPDIWDTLRLGMIEAQKFKEYNTCLMIFTEWEANENPPMGIIPILREAISDIKEVNFSIFTYAFGCNFDSKLMEVIAQIGNGIYGYCLDCTLVGIIFTNFMANILTTIESTVRIGVKNKYLEKKFEIGGLYSRIPIHLGFSMKKMILKIIKLHYF